MNTNPDEHHPKEWLLGILKELAVIQTGTESKCSFGSGEEWKRTESQRFRCLFGMLRLAYERNKDDHPAVLYEQWLYDIGLYHRANVHTDFMCQNFDLTNDLISQLTNLGQAVERDLRRRKQPNKDPKYYLKRVSVSEENWMVELFPAGPHGTICPLLMCPFQNAVSNEVSGLQGLSVCLSMTLAKCLRQKYRLLQLPLRDVLVIIKTFCSFFIRDVARMIPEMEARFGSISLRKVVLNLVNENAFDKYLLQSVFNLYGIKLLSKSVLVEFSNFLHKHEGIDVIVDGMRARIREAMFDEINYVLFQNRVNNKVVTRLNLTDSDLIGGDNSRQEMSSAAFISETGVLVSWHLTGRMRF